MDVDDSSKTFPRKLVEGQKAQYNFMLVCGDKEVEGDTVSPRRREEEGMSADEKKSLGMPAMKIDDIVVFFNELAETHKR